MGGGEVEKPRSERGRGCSPALPTEAWPGAQDVLKFDFKVKKPDSEVVAMLQWVWKLERGDHAEGTRRA